MSNIYGVELKAIKETVGMEGSGFYANIYVEGKKIGSCADYGNGGSLCIYCDKSKDEKKLEAIADAYFAAHPAEVEFLENLEMFLYKVYELKQREADFKKYAKKGYRIMVIMNFPLSHNGPIPHKDTFFCNNPLTAEMQKKTWQKDYPDAFFDTYSSEADFIIAQK